MIQYGNYKRVSMLYPRFNSHKGQTFKKTKEYIHILTK